MVGVFNMLIFQPKSFHNHRKMLTGFSIRDFIIAGGKTTGNWQGNFQLFGCWFPDIMQFEITAKQPRLFPLNFQKTGFEPLVRI